MLVFVDKIILSLEVPVAYYLSLAMAFFVTAMTLPLDWCSRMKLGHSTISGLSPWWSNRPKGRLARSAACRHWYHWRQHARKTGANPPLWVWISPPLPVLKLACRIAGKSAFVCAFLAPAGLLASLGEVSELRLEELSGDDDLAARQHALSELAWQ